MGVGDACMNERRSTALPFQMSESWMPWRRSTSFHPPASMYTDAVTVEGRVLSIMVSL